MSVWIDITTCSDLHPVYVHRKTGKNIVIKRTELDDAYDRYWSSPRSNPDPTELLAAVRQFVLKVKHDEDIAQEVALRIFEGLETFSRSDPTAFTRWVRRVMKLVSLESFKSSSLHTREYEEAAIEQPSERSEYLDCSRLPSDFRRIAGLIISGYSLDEIAASFKITTPALRKKMQRYREKYCHKKSTKIINS